MLSLRRFSAALILVIFSGLFLAACGGGEPQEAKIEAAIREELKAEAPAICPAMETATMQKQVHEHLIEALENCEAGDTGKSLVKSIKVANVEVDGESATADVTIEGGNLAGQTVTMALNKHSGEWEIHRVPAFQHYDRRALLQAFMEGVDEVAKTPAEKRFAACVVRELRNETQRQIKRLMLNPAPSPFDFRVELCALQ